MSETATARLPRPQSSEQLHGIAQEAPNQAGTLWTPVAFYPALKDGADPADVTVLAYRNWPAVFYRITSEQAGIDLTTGIDPHTRLGLHDLAHGIAEAICAGLLGVSEDDHEETAG